MTTTTATLESATVSLLMVLFYFYTGFRVGNLRGKHKIEAPACSGHPEFDRAYRVQLNTLEQLAIALPALWLATLYPIGWPWLAPLIALIWTAARILYMRAYMTNPANRVQGAMLTGFCDAALMALAVIGLALAWSRLGS